jgi:hypothetical protein
MGLRPTYMDENRGERSVTMEPAWDGEDRAYSGFVEAVSEFGLGRVFWTNLCCAIRPCGMVW